MKTADLIDQALDWAVTYAQHGEAAHYVFRHNPGFHHYSTDWAQGGPIIERERIAVVYEPSMVYDDSCRWKALWAMGDEAHEFGPTPLIAAMRCYVASKLGDEVEVPDELV